MARAGVQVVTNPLDNIVLQGRGDRYPKRRGLTRVDELWAAGAVVGIGEALIGAAVGDEGVVVECYHRLARAGDGASDRCGRAAAR